MEPFIPGRFEISIERDGKTYSGYYTMSCDMITVNYDCHSTSTQKSYSNDILAKIILGELVKKYGTD